MELNSLIKELQTKCKSSKGFMGVNLGGVKVKEDLIENVRDEVFSVSELIKHSDIEEEMGLTLREAKGYVKKLESFIERHEEKSNG